MYEDNFTFHINKNRPTTARFNFLKKKTGWVEDDFTSDVVFHPNDLTPFYKKTIQRTHFYKFDLNQPQNTKMPGEVCVIFLKEIENENKWI